ncbi:MAG: transcription antitermination factor NusB [Haliscomenobacter sp.]|nr:transcription antitermination factor NusB [Haliscomenobacter sp.]
MLSRRNVRIKVMQMLYALGRDKQLSFADAMRRYRETIARSFEMYLFHLLYFIRAAEYAEKDAGRRKAKHRPTEEDKSFSPRIAQNPLIDSLRRNPLLNTLFTQYRLQEKIDEDLVRGLYAEFSKQDSYKVYLQITEPGPSDHAEQLLSLLRTCFASETFEDATEDWYPNWIDDKSLIVGAMKKTVKALPAEPLFFDEFKPQAEATVEFGEALLQKVYEEDQHLLEVIEPTLKNWDAERVAIIDMILLKMALCELTSFPTIPTKVTLNEFVEISKLYSTEKSKDFINGILDRLMKKLNSEGRIHKEGRGLLEE